MTRRRAGDCARQSRATAADRTRDAVRTARRDARCPPGRLVRPPAPDQRQARPAGIPTPPGTAMSSASEGPERALGHRGALDQHGRQETIARAAHESGPSASIAPPAAPARARRRHRAATRPAASGRGLRPRPAAAVAIVARRWARSASRFWAVPFDTGASAPGCPVGAATAAPFGTTSASGSAGAADLGGAFGVAAVRGAAPASISSRATSRVPERVALRGSSRLPASTLRQRRGASRTGRPSATSRSPPCRCRVRSTPGAGPADSGRSIRLRPRCRRRRRPLRSTAREMSWQDLRAGLSR